MFDTNTTIDDWLFLSVQTLVYHIICHVVYTCSECYLLSIALMTQNRSNDPKRKTTLIRTCCYLSHIGVRY